MEYLIKQYPLDTGALEIQYIEEFFGEFPRKKTAAEIANRLSDREFLILMAEARLPDDAGTVVPVAFKVVHELREVEPEPKLRDLVNRLKDSRPIRRTEGALQLDWRNAARLARAGAVQGPHRGVGGLGSRIRLS